MKEFFDTLLRCPLFEGMNREDLEAMLPCLGARTAQYEKNQTIFLEGDPAQAVGIVLEGSVQVVREDYYGNRSLLSLLPPPQIFGETFACAQVDTLPVSVVAASPCTVLLMDCRKMVTTCTNTCLFHQRLVSRLLRVIASKNLMLNQKVSYLSQRTTREKLLAFLLAQAKEAGSNEFTIPFDRQALADYLGVERSAMSTELGKLKKSGVLTFQKSHFKLL